MLSQFLQFPFLNLEQTIANEKKEYSKILYVNGEMDFGLRYDLQVKLKKKKINKHTNNKIFVSKFRVNYGFLTN